MDIRIGNCGSRIEERVNGTLMTRITRIIADKTKKDQRQSALSVSSAFYQLVHRFENHYRRPDSMKTGLIGLWCLILTGACATEGAQSATSRSGQTQVDIHAIDAFTRRAFDIGATPGLGVAIVANGRIIYSASLGFADMSASISASDSTLWYVASTSKSFTGFGVALLEADGALNVDAPITKLLPRASWHPAVHPAEITLASFLTHTHGISDDPLVTSAAYTGAIPEAEWGDLLRLHAPLPTRQLAYSNLGYNVASMVIDALRPEGWKAFLNRRVFRPAGLDIRSAVSGAPPSRIAKSHRLEAGGRFVSQPFAKRDITMNAAGGHLATVNDLARWVIAHLEDGRLEGKQVYPAAAVRRSHEILARQPPNKRFAFFDRDGWGMGWDIGRYEGERMVSRFGSYTGFRSHLSMLPDRGIGVVAVVNSSSGSGITDIIAAYAYDRLLGRPDAEERGASRLDSLATRLQTLRRRAGEEEVARAARQRPLPRPIANYTGRFDNPGFGRIVVSETNGKLMIRWGVLESALAPYDVAKDQFSAVLLGGENVVRFGFGPEGPAQDVTIDNATFARAR
jgi:CubicO group peptidase (beta-lactamase class C family)